MVYPQYQEMFPATIKSAMEAVLDIWEQFVVGIKSEDVSGETHELYSVNLDVLRDIVVRVNKREAYFQIFHNSMKMSEYKELALYAFWIVKLRPFTLLQHFEPFAGKENAEFALFYIFYVLKNIAERESQHTDLESLGDPIYREIVYSFQYRDISKEALILIVELIAKIVNMSDQCWSCKRDITDTPDNAQSV